MKPSKKKERLADKVYLDANVVIDLFDTNEALAWETVVLIDYCFTNRISVCTSLVTIAIANYFFDKKLGTKEKVKAMNKLAEVIEIVPNLPVHFSHALKAKNKDYEDALHFFAALDAGCSYLISEDGEFSSHSTKHVQVINRATFLSLIQ